MSKIIKCNERQKTEGQAERDRGLLAHDSTLHITVTSLCDIKTVKSSF